MKCLFEFEVFVENCAYSFKPQDKIDHRKFKKILIKSLKCNDVSMVVYTKVDAIGKMLIDRVFCTEIRYIKRL